MKNYIDTSDQQMKKDFEGVMGVEEISNLQKILWRRRKGGGGEGGGEGGMTFFPLLLSL